MSKKNLLYILSVMILSLLFIGCGEAGSGGTPKVQRSVDLSLAALYAAKTGQSRALTHNRAVSIMTGELQALNHTTGTTETFVWSAYMNDTDLNVTSNKTIALEPGDYTFSLLLNDANNQYIGTSALEVIADNTQNSIPLTVAPVIGDTVANVSVIANLATYKFSYIAAELASLVNPQIGVMVDGGVEEIFTVNKATGFSQAYLSLLDGAHNVHLAFYDGNIQVGRSAPAQESITVVAGEPLNIDIVPIHGETEFLIDVNGSNATIKANISQEIINEIGLSDLQVIMLLSNGSTTYENNMTLVTENNATYGITTVPNMQFGTYAFQLTFNDLKDTSVPVGSCLIQDANLSTSGSTLNCEITLQRRSVLGGNLLSTVGINVFNINKEPIAGAFVYANDKLIGLTNEGSFGTKGYLKTYHVSGNVVFRAEDATNTGDANITLSPLDVKNVDIILGTQIQPVVAPVSVSGKSWKYDLNATGDALSWVDSNATLPSALGGSQTAVIGDYIYLFGGYNGSSLTNVIYKAPITNPTAWVDTNATLPGALINSQTALIGNYVYLFGGYNGSYTNVIYRAPITNPTAWVDTNVTLPSALGNSQTAVIGDYVYLFGGVTNGSTFTNVIYRAPVADPTLWTNTGSILPAIVGGSQTAVIGDYIYLFGGDNGVNSATNVIYRAPITDPTTWIDTGATLPSNLASFQTAVIGNYVYLFGGRNGNIYMNLIYRAPITNPTAWVDTGLKLPSNLGVSQTAVIGDYVYLFGGLNGINYTNVIYKSKIYN